MDTLIFTCEKCKEEIKLSEGTTKIGVNKMAEEYGDEWLDKLRQESGERAGQFIKEVKEHANTCGGQIKHTGSSTSC